jgi:hypothetical protein
MTLRRTGRPENYVRTARIDDAAGRFLACRVVVAP